MEKFNRYNIPEEIDKYQGIVMDAGAELSVASSRVKKLEILLKETPKDQKKELEIIYSKLYCKYKDQGGSEALIKAKVLSDSEYIKTFSVQKKKIQILTNKYEEAIQKEVQATANYYLSRDRIKLMESSIKLLIGEFYNLNENKIKKEI